ncbi:hypothetical protein AcV5_009977 [Taiwanofungus camphoratus]|nr:hypothetical protein AcV5_009977 [Antrodia cinnamomea]KAI0945860.1 hypothetical protein AcV7_009985 [Antrodia cinnamomea]
MSNFPQLDRIDPSTTAQNLFLEYISKRRPVIIRGLPDDMSFQAQKWTNMDYLASKAGDTKVLVEPMHPTTLQFGTDVERISMPFREFLTSLQSENGSHHYLTTQYSGDGDALSPLGDALTAFSPPTDALKDDFPIVPRLMGNLFLQQANLWLGKSKDGSSSGLHHDFHDNLYCLLKGRKRFVLFPPQEHVHLCPYGELHKLHENGVIAYDSMLRADGLDERIALQARVRALERKLEACRGMKGKGKGKRQEIATLEQMHGEAVQQLSNLAMDEEFGFELVSSDSENDEDESSAQDEGSLMEDLTDGHDDYDALIGDLEESDADHDAAGLSGSSKRKHADSMNSEDDDQLPVKEPDSFSRIPTAYLHRQLDLPTTAAMPPSSGDFVTLAKATPPYVVELSAGEMLYLPASWWHEVTSSSPSNSSQEQEDSSAVHMAFNYWFYPPDADKFEAPYKDTLVWEYLRERASKSASMNGENGVNVAPEGKRKRDDADEATKRARWGA